MNAINTQFDIDTTPSLARSSMLVDLSFSQWTGRKKDRATSEEVVANKNARSKNAASVYNALLGDCKELSDINKFVSKARAQHMKLTLPWNDGGTRLLPTKAILTYTDFLNDTQAEFDRLVANFIAKYPTLRAAASFELGDLFDADNYPDQTEVAKKFGMRCEFTPVPDTGDFRLDVDKDIMEHMGRQYEQVMERRFAQAQQDLWERLHAQLTQMSDRLQVVDGKANVFRDSLIENANDLVDMLAMLNPTNDPELENARVRLKMTLSGVDAEVLRKSPDIREATRNRVNELLDMFDFGV